MLEIKTGKGEVADLYEIATAQTSGDFVLGHGLVFTVGLFS